MSESNFMHWWMNLVGSIAIIALILTALGIMVGIAKPADALSRIGATLGAVIRTDPRPAHPCERLLGHDTVATDWPRCNWNRRLAVAATSTADTKEIE
jgi:hypothetical protein